MAVAYQSSQTNFTAATSLVITKPTSLAVGDLMVAWIYYSGAPAGNQTISSPGSWTSVANNKFSDGGGNNASEIRVFTKIADSSDTAASNFTFTCSRAIRGGITRITGQGPTTPIEEVVDYVDFLTAVTSPVSKTAGMTPSRANSLFMVFIVYLITSVADYAFATSNPTWAEIHDGNNIAVAYANRTETTDTGNFGFTFSGSSPTNMAGAIICVNPTLDVTVTPNPVTSATAIADETVTGGAVVAVNPVTTALTVEDAEANQATWSNQSKNTTSWTNQSKN